MLNISLYFAGLIFCFATIVFETFVKKTSFSMTFRVYKHILPNNVCPTENFLYLSLCRNSAAKIIEISVGYFGGSVLAPPRNSSRISTNFRCGISADWKIWEILGRDWALITLLQKSVMEKSAIIYENNVKHHSCLNASSIKRKSKASYF